MASLVTICSLVALSAETNAPEKAAMVAEGRMIRMVIGCGFRWLFVVVVVDATEIGRAHV